MSEKRFRLLAPFQGSRQVIIKDCETCKSATVDIYDDNIDYFVDLLNSLNDENEQLRKELYESEKHYLIETSDISDKPYLEEELSELKKKYGVADE